MSISKMSVCMLCIIYLSINFGSLALLLKDYPESNTDYFATSSKIGESYDEIHRKLQNGSVTFKITLEPHLEFELHIEKRSSNVFDHRTSFRSFENDKITTLEKNLLEKTIDSLVEGVVYKENYSSYVVGYIKSSNFYGTVETAERTFFIIDINTNKNLCDKYKNTSYNAIVYKIEKFTEIPVNGYYGMSFLKNGKSKRSIRSSNDYNLFKQVVGEGKVCSLFILIDNSFVKILHQGDTQSALAQVLHTLDEANSIFRSTDFDEDGEPDNIGFYVKYLIILESENTILNTLPQFGWQPIDGRIYTMRFSQYLILNEVCLGIAFTAQPFRHKILGLSYTAEIENDKVFKVSVGGICDRMPKQRPLSNFNTLVITGIFETGRIVPQHIMDMSLAHELGHSFGSLHDNTEECDGYIMSSQVPKEFHRQRYTFSSCSKRAIIRTILQRGHCLQEEESPFCGNGKVEPGEVCDCGTARDCAQLDVCCIPRGKSDECKVNYSSGYECHPSEGKCCSDKCLIKNLTTYGLDCSNFNRTCPCEKNSKSCSCGVDGKCTNDICSSSECTRINLVECECPHLVNMSKCNICCSYKNQCLTSAKASEIILKENRDLLKQFKKISESNINKKYGFVKEICKDSDCVTLFFRSVDAGDYCLSFGKVGICSLTNQCVVKKMKNVFPALRAIDKAENSANMINFNSQNIRVILILFGHFNNIFRMYISLFN